MGAASGALADAANGAIFLMLGVLVFVMVSLCVSGFVLVGRANRTLMPHEKLVLSFDKGEGSEL
jgi:hypothetical protein